MPRSVAEDMPAVSAVATMSAEQDGVAQLSAAFVVAYDDIASVRYVRSSHCPPFSETIEARACINFMNPRVVMT